MARTLACQAGNVGSIPITCSIKYAGLAQLVEQLTCLQFCFNTKLEVFKIELTSKEKGNLTELQCLTAFYELGHKVSIPYGENCRYDFILDVNGTLLKIQVKTSKFVSDECFEFATRSTRTNAKGSYSTTYTKEEIDFFATYYQNQCYLVPVEECGVSKKLRFNYPKNGQKKGICLAKDYEVKEVLKQFE